MDPVPVETIENLILNQSEEILPYLEYYFPIYTNFIYKIKTNKDFLNIIQSGKFLETKKGLVSFAKILKHVYPHIKRPEARFLSLINLITFLSENEERPRAKL